MRSVMIDICRDSEGPAYYEIGEERWTLDEIVDLLKREAAELEES